jgi:alpha/beta superfamily hydrolase
MAAMRVMRTFGAVLLAGIALDARAVTADYAREDRLAAEIVPAIVVGDPVYLATPRRPRVLAIYTAPPGKPIGAALIVHGLGVHPDWGLINGLRTDLADAGLATLSVQMPVFAGEASRGDYVALYAEADERIAAGIAFLEGHGIGKVAIVAHSLGATMANAYLASPAAASVVAWVPIGMQGAFAAPPREPVLDVVAQNDRPEVLKAASARADSLPRDSCSRQVTIPGTDHFMANRRKELAEAVVRFLQVASAGSCRR